MGIFIDIIIRRSMCTFENSCRECINVCPVDIFYVSSNGLEVREEDECTLCNRCIEECPGDAIRIVRKYLQS